MIQDLTSNPLRRNLLYFHSVPTLRHANPKPLQDLLSAHRLLTCNSFAAVPPLGLGEPEHLAQFKLKHSPRLLCTIDKALTSVSFRFTPTHEPLVRLPCPTKKDTESFKRHLVGTSERARTVTSVHHTRGSVSHIDYVVKYLLRPLNELLKCMLLPTGLMLFWRLGTHPSNRTTAELVWAQLKHPPEVLAVMDVKSPMQLSDVQMHILVESIRKKMLKVDKEGKVVIANPMTADTRSPTCEVVGKLLEKMFKTEASISVITNCNRFLVINASAPTKHADDNLFEFSDLVFAEDRPTPLLVNSPLGLLLGISVLATHQRGLSLRSGYELITAATTLSVFRTLMTEHFPLTNRHSYVTGLRRRGIPQMGMYPSQLGPTSFSFHMPWVFTGHLSPATRATMSSFQLPFHGPIAPAEGLPKLLPDPPSDAWWVPELQFVDFHGKGDVWDVFSVAFSWLTTVDANLIVKFCNVSPTTNEGTLSALTARLAMLKECRLYTGELYKLQGLIIPRFLGLFGSCQRNGNQVWCAMHEHAGVRLLPGKILNPRFRALIREMYITLHLHDVIHNDVAWRHILKGADGPRLISFDRAVVRSTETDFEWAALCQVEMEAVDKLLGEGEWAAEPPLEDIIEHPPERRNNVVTRLRRVSAGLTGLDLAGLDPSLRSSNDTPPQLSVHQRPKSIFRRASQMFRTQRERRTAEPQPLPEYLEDIPLDIPSDASP